MESLHNYHRRRFNSELAWTPSSVSPEKINMPTAIAFDVYGTLVNPHATADHLQPLVGNGAARFAELWRAKQLE